MRSVTRCPERALSLLVAALTATLWPGCTTQTVPEAKISPPDPPVRLVVVTPHNQRIRAKFERGFAQWHTRQYQKAVDIHWIVRGTPQCLACVADAASNDEIALRRLAPDLMFGGGITDHQWLVDHGLARPLTKPVPEEASIPATLLGVPLRDEQGYWHATALTSFGIFYHKQGCAERGVPQPKTWSDLADPAYYGWIALADPTRSGSNRFCMGLILQRHGWDKGWGLVLRMAANARTLLPASSSVLENVSAGMCLAGPSVNFNAMHESVAVGGGRLAFVTPADAGAITPDATTVLSYASSPELAERFVRYCLSEEGQALWSLRGLPGVQTEQVTDPALDGEPLYRYPIVPSIYDKYAGRLSVEGNPFKQETQFAVDMALEWKQAKIIAPLLAAACGENHVLLQRAWKAIIDAGMPTQALAELTGPLFDEQTAYELGIQHEKGGEQARRLSEEWSAKFRAKYEKVLAGLRG